MSQSRLPRILRLLEALRSGIASNVNTLAEECGVSKRTIYRDLKTLRTAGIPLQFDRELERYSVEQSQTLPPMVFSSEEAFAIIALAQEIGSIGKLPFYEHATTAAQKLLSSLPLPLQKELTGSAKSVRIQLPPVNPLKDRAEYYQLLLDASHKKHAVKIQYESLTEWEPIQTRLFPYQLLFSRHSWYVIGRSSIHKSIRTFNVGRIVGAEPQKEKFHIPRTFTLEKHLRNAWHLIPERGPDSQVVIRFSQFVARNVSEVAWHKTQECHFNQDGSLDFHVTVSGLNEIAWWILGYGDQAQVLKPVKLRKIIQERIKRMAAMYATEKQHSTAKKERVSS